jgi:hypothetical protein
VQYYMVDRVLYAAAAVRTSHDAIEQSFLVYLVIGESSQ